MYLVLMFQLIQTNVCSQAHFQPWIAIYKQPIYQVNICFLFLYVIFTSGLF